MKIKDVPINIEKVLNMLPVSQPEMWKNLGINSRDGSELVSIMIKKCLIKRKRQDGRFILEKMNGNGNTEKYVNINPEKISEEDELKKKAKEDELLKKIQENELKKKAKEDELLKKIQENELKKKAKEDELKKKAEIFVSALKKYGPNMITKDVLKKEILIVLPLKQSEMWKILGIDSRKCSRIVEEMIKEHIITRTKINNTFIIENILEPKKMINFEPMVNKGEFSPCAGCRVLACDPTVCIILEKWILK